MKISEFVKWHIDIIGPWDRLQVHPEAGIAESHFKLHVNTSSGSVKIGKFAFFGAGVMLLAASHDYSKFGEDRMDWLREGFDIKIEEGAWIGSGAIIIGPCVVGKNSVVGAGSVVTHDVLPFSVVGGNPAKLIRPISH